MKLHFDAFIAALTEIAQSVNTVLQREPVHGEDDVCELIYSWFAPHVSISIEVGVPDDDGPWYNVTWTTGPGRTSSARTLTQTALDELKHALKEMNNADSQI